MNITTLIKNITPPFLVTLLRKSKPKAGTTIYTGDYPNYEQAAANSEGYGDEIIVNKVKDAVLQVKNGTAKYERDSVLFDKVQYSWPLLAILQNIAIQNNLQLSLIDFGGSLGSTYFQNRDFLKPLDKLDWRVVEQKAFVATGKEHFEDNKLRFFYSIEEALDHGKPDMLLLSGVLQYLPKPYEFLTEVLNLNIPSLVFDRTAFIRSQSDRITIQQVSESIYASSYPCTFVSEEKFTAMILSKYELISDFDSYADVGSYLQDGKKVYWKGFYFRLKS